MSVFAGIDAIGRELVVEDLIGRLRSWHHASPSQIKRFRECPSAWYLESVLSFPRPETAATAAGKAMHAELEDYLKTGKPPGPLGAAGLAFLPLPPVDVELVEVPLAIWAPGLVPVVLKIDLVDPDRRATIVDYKSTSSIAKYAKSADELRADPQAVIYAVGLAPTFAALAGGRPPALAPEYVTPARPGREVERYPGVALDLEALDAIPDGIRFEHVYYQRRPIRTDRAAVLLSPDDVRQGWQGIDATVREMMQTATAPHVAEIPHSLDACGNYGGCQFRRLCAGLGRRTLGVASVFFTDPAFGGTPLVTQGLPTMGLLESLARRQAAQVNARGADPFALGAAVLEASRAAASPAVAPADEDAEEAALERQLAARRDAKAAAAEAAKAFALQAAELERQAAHAAELEAAKAFAAQSAELERQRAAAAELVALRAAAAAAVTHPTINPPDGLPDGAPLPVVEALPKDPDPVIPRIDDVPPVFRGARLKSLKKEAMISLFCSLRSAANAKSLAAPAAISHLWKAPPEGLPEAKRTAIKYGCEVALAMLTGKPIPSRDADDGETPAPSGAAHASTAPSEVLETPAASPAPPEPRETPAPSEVLETPAPSGAASRVLYVGCAPRRVAVVYLSELLAPMIAAAEADLGVAHYRIPQFKRGFDAVAVRLSHALRSGEMTPPAALVVELDLPLAREVLPELLAYYPIVIEPIG